MNQQGYQFNYKSTDLEFKNLMIFLKSMSKENTHRFDHHAKLLSKVLGENYLKSEKKNGGIVEIDLDFSSIFSSGEVFEVEDAMAYHVKNNDLLGSDGAKVYLACSHDRMLESWEFKKFIDECLESDLEAIRLQAIENLKRPWERN